MMLGCAWRSLHQPCRQLMHGSPRHVCLMSARRRSAVGVGIESAAVVRPVQWRAPSRPWQAGVPTAARRSCSSGGRDTRDKSTAAPPPPGSSQDHAGSSSSGGGDQQALSPEVLLLRARFILSLRLVMRLKRMKMALVGCMAGSGLLGYSHGAVVWISVLAASGVSALVARFATRIVLRLSYHPDEQLLRVSTLNYAGRRVDFLVDAEHVVPYGESQRQHPTAMLHKLEVYGSRAPRLYSLRHSDVEDLDTLAELLWLPPELGGVRDLAWTRAQTAADARAEEAQRPRAAKENVDGRT